MSVSSGSMGSTTEHRRSARLTRSGGGGMGARRRREGWLMALPAVVLLAVLGLFPLLYSLTLSFRSWDLQNRDRTYPFIGLDNYADALTDDRVWGALRNTGVILLAAVGIEFFLGLLLATIFVGELRGKRLIIPILMLPVMVVPVVVGLTWRMLWDNQYGAVNELISRVMGREVTIVWLAQTRTAIAAMVITDVWQWTPFMFLILLAGLTAVNPELYQAAELDGAGAWALMRDITLPGISRIIAVAILFRGLDAFKFFDFIYMFTQGGPGTSTETISWYIYQLGFKFFRMGYAASVSYLALLLLTVAASIYVGRFLRESDR